MTVLVTRGTACSLCGTQHERKNQRYCHACHATYMRGWRVDNPLSEAHRERRNSRALARHYKNRNGLQKTPCQACGAPKSEMHHPDHELPRFVVFLCRPCHLAWHAHWRATALKVFNDWLQTSSLPVLPGKTDGPVIGELKPSLTAGPSSFHAGGTA